jgi:hypothetical protein
MSCEEDEVLFERLVDPRELVKSTKRRFAALTAAAAAAASAPLGTNGTAAALDQSVTDELTRIVRAELAPLCAQSLNRKRLLWVEIRPLTRRPSAVDANHAAVIQMLQTMQRGGEAAVVPRVKRRAPPKKKEAPAPLPAPLPVPEIAIAVDVEVDDPGCKEEKVDAVKVEPIDDFVFNERAARKYRAQMSRTTNGMVYSV